MPVPTVPLLPDVLLPVEGAPLIALLDAELLEAPLPAEPQPCCAPGRDMLPDCVEVPALGGFPVAFVGP